MCQDFSLAMFPKLNHVEISSTDVVEIPVVQQCRSAIPHSFNLKGNWFSVNHCFPAIRYNGLVVMILNVMVHL